MKNPVAPVINSSTSRSQSEAVECWAARLTWRTLLAMNMLTPYTMAIPATVPIRREGYHSGIGVPASLTPVRATPPSRMVALNRPRNPQIVSAWMSHRRRYNGSAGWSSLQSSRYRRWPIDSTPSAAHSAAPDLARAARPPNTLWRLTPSLRATRRAIPVIPTTPDSAITTITATPVQWISPSGTNVKSASDAASCGPWEAYMNMAKKTTTAVATSEPMTGRVYRILESPVGS